MIEKKVAFFNNPSNIDCFNLDGNQDTMKMPEIIEIMKKSSANDSIKNQKESYYNHKVLQTLLDNLLKRVDEKEVKNEISGVIEESMINKSNKSFSVNPVSTRFKENRNFLHLNLGGKIYRALFDPGAMVSVAGPTIAKHFQDKLQIGDSAIKNATGNYTEVLGILNVKLDVDGHVDVLQIRAVNELDHELILGMDFCEIWDIECKLARSLWRAKEGKWKKFDDNSTATKDYERIFAECAGLAIVNDVQTNKANTLVENTLLKTSKATNSEALREHVIDVQGAMPIRNATRPMTKTTTEVVKKEVQKMFRDGILERSSSVWSNTPIVVKKSDGTYKFNVDYRDLNDMTRKAVYPKQNVDATLENLEKARFATKINLKHVHQQIIIEKSSREYTAFSVPDLGLWQYRKMPFGLANAIITFRRMIDSIFKTEFDPYVILHQDGLIIISNNFDEHLKWLGMVMTTLIEAGITIGKDNFEVCCSSISYSGYIFDKNGLRLDPERIAPILTYPIPTNVLLLRRFTDLLTWYFRFFQDYHKKHAALLQLFNKNQPWVWGVNQKHAFDSAKKTLTAPPVLIEPDFSTPFAVKCNTSNYLIGGVLIQYKNVVEHVVAYVNRSLTAVELGYSASEKECLAMLWAIKKFRPYLEGQKFEVVTDRFSYQWLKNHEEPTGRLAMWSMELQQYDFEVVHRTSSLLQASKTTENKVAAAAPPPPPPGTTKVPLDARSIIKANKNFAQKFKPPQPVPQKNIQRETDKLEYHSQMEDYESPFNPPPQRFPQPYQVVQSLAPNFTPSLAPTLAPNLTPSLAPSLVPGPYVNLQTKTGGVMYNDIKLIPTDPNIDPPPFSCFNCWRHDHITNVCKLPPILFCLNCGRKDIDVANCPRCFEAHRAWMVRQHSGQPQKWQNLNHQAEKSSRWDNGKQQFQNNQVHQAQNISKQQFPNNQVHQVQNISKQQFQNNQVHQVPNNSKQQFQNNQVRQPRESVKSRLEPRKRQVTPPPYSRKERKERKDDSPEWQRVPPPPPKISDNSNNRDKSSKWDSKPSKNNDIAAPFTTGSSEEKVSNVLKLMQSLQHLPEDTKNAVLRSIFADA